MSFIVTSNAGRRRNAGGKADPATATPASSVATPAAPVTVAQSKQTAVKSELAISGPAMTPDVLVTLVCGGLTHVEAPVTIGARYDGLGFAGPTKVFDRVLDSWLTRAVDLGIIGSALGQLFPINLAQFHKAGKLNARTHTLLVAGMGEPGRFAEDSLQFIFSNIIVAIKAMGADEFATSLLGTRRKELPIADAVRGFVHGIDDGYERIKAIADSVTEDQAALRATVQQPLSIVLVHSEPDQLEQIREELAAIVKAKKLRHLNLIVRLGDPVAADPNIEPTPLEGEPGTPVVYLRATRSKSPAARAAPAKVTFPGKRKKSAPRRAIDRFPTDIFRFSALSDVAVVPEREQLVNGHLLHQLADRMTKIDPTAAPGERARQGDFFTNLMIPDDFRKLIEGPASVTLEVDEATAVYPWEMAGYKKLSNGFFLGTNVAISRQFRTLLSPPPTSPSTLNNQLNALIIADPAAGDWKLPGARIEGAAVVEVLEKARVAWGGQYVVKVTVRIGPPEDKDDANTKALLQNLSRYKVVDTAKTCDPLELAMLLVNEQYDLVHYAGHGICDPKSGQTGWIFAEDCVLSAKEIFRIRQVPRLVFANACFSAVTSDSSEEPRHMAGLAQAFFGRGIPNYIGAGWKVDDSCAQQCARSFYACLMGLTGYGPDDGVAAGQSDATIGRALQLARKMAADANPESSSWGAYQHYGHVGDRLVSIGNVKAAQAGQTMREPPATIAGTVVQAPNVPSATTKSGEMQMATDENATMGFAPDDPNLVYVNGIDFNTGNYAVKPRSIGDIAKQVADRPGVGTFDKTRGEKPRAFALPFGRTDKLEDAGWGIIFPADTPDPIRKALAPLIEFRGKRAGKRLKVLDYNKGEQLRDWYVRQGISPGNLSPGKVPFYLLLIGPPDQIPFEFQYLLGIEYAVGRLAFDDAAGYESYVRSTIAYESSAAVPNAKKISYWGTRHLGDGATKLSSSFLLDPLVNGVPDDDVLEQPINKVVGYDQELFLAKNATKANLLGALHAAKPPALLFTASHGMAFDPGQAEQISSQGALLCQDWPGFGNVKTEHFLTASDIADDANVNGVVAFLFACFGAGTPDTDQFLMDLSQAGSAPPLAPKPFIAALPRRLLTHPKGSALAVIGHIDRAWGFSMQAPQVSTPQIGTFFNSLGSILTGMPVGHAISERFGARYAELSAFLLNATAPTVPAAARPSDQQLVAAWLERNDAQNYVLLGDPAVSIRNDLLT
jgi:hypothetical protein